MGIAKKAQNEFKKFLDDFGSDPFYLLPHVFQMEKLAKYFFEKHPEIDREIVLLAIWLHDIGHYPIPSEIDHAIQSEERAKDFLELNNYPEEKMEKVLHCVRSHRCFDVQPNSLEAKLVACIDSASHMLDTAYFRIAQYDKENSYEFRSYGKIERDFRDLAAFPEFQKEFIGLYKSWKKLIKEYEKFDLS